MWSHLHFRFVDFSCLRNLWKWYFSWDFGCFCAHFLIQQWFFSQRHFCSFVKALNISVSFRWFTDTLAKTIWLKVYEQLKDDHCWVFFYFLKTWFSDSALHLKNFWIMLCTAPYRVQEHEKWAEKHHLIHKSSYFCHSVVTCKQKMNPGCNRSSQNKRKPSRQWLAFVRPSLWLSDLQRGWFSSTPPSIHSGQRLLMERL